MTTTKHPTAKQSAERIEENVRAMEANEITWYEFGRRQRAAWDAVTRGELPIIGSAASRRQSAVLKFLNSIQ